MLYQGQKIKIETDDSREFIEIINTIVGLLILQFGIDEISYVKIKNWFDHKWLNFSGKSVVHFDSGGMFERDASLHEEWREKITIPPFHPNRVLSEKFVRKRKTGNKKFEEFLHKKKPSNNNIHNRISDYTQNGLFVWYSSNSKINSKGSLMIYRVQENKIETWYATLEKNQKWKIIQTKGIGLNELKMYLSENDDSFPSSL